MFSGVLNEKEVICLVSLYCLNLYSRKINMIVIKMAGINYLWSLTSLLNLSVTLALDLTSRTSHNIDCRQQATFIEWKSVYFYSCLKLASGSSFITSTIRHRCVQLMICRNDYFKPPLAMACLAELFFKRAYTCIRSAHF